MLCQTHLAIRSGGDGADSVTGVPRSGASAVSMGTDLDLASEDVRPELLEVAFSFSSYNADMDPALSRGASPGTSIVANESGGIRVIP